MAIDKEEQRRLKKKEKRERKRHEIEARARSKTIRKTITILIVVGIIAGFGYLVYVAVASSPGIGPLNSAHEHADWAIYINGEPARLNSSRYQLKSEYVHMEGGTDTIHMHATNVRIGYFIDTIGMKLTSTSLTVDGVTYSNEGDKRVRMFVNGEENFEYEKYVLKSQDKILIVYGNENDSQIQEYIKTIPDLAKDFDRPEAGR